MPDFQLPVQYQFCPACVCISDHILFSSYRNPASFFYLVSVCSLHTTTALRSFKSDRIQQMRKPDKGGRGGMQCDSRTKQSPLLLKIHPFHVGNQRIRGKLSQVSG
ncbi:unnamed protein product [Caretta caretta]